MSNTVLTKFVKDDCLDIFPVSDYRRLKPQNLYLSEPTLTAIFQAFFDDDSFVVNAERNNVDDDTPSKLTFIIHGYVVILDSNGIRDILDQLNSEAITNIYAHIWIDNTTGVLISGEELRQDSAGSENLGESTEGIWQYLGVTFSNSYSNVVGPHDYTGTTDMSVSCNCSHYYLHILEKSDNKWRAPTDSRYRFSSDSIRNITGGTV